MTTKASEEGTRLEAVLTVVGLGLGVILFTVLGARLADFEPEEAGLGLDSYAQVSDFRGRRISAQAFDLDETQAVVETFRALHAEGRPVALWLGASQLHTMNNPKPGDQVAAYYASKSAEERGSDLAYLQVSTPNASLHDLLALYLLFRQRDLFPAWLIVAIVYDDLREPEMQSKVLAQLEPFSPTDAQTLGGAVLHVSDALEANRAESEPDGAVERTAITGTPQALLEDAIVSRLEAVWPAFRSRGKVTATVQGAVEGSFALVRGSFMGRRISPVPAIQLEWNLEALETLIAVTQRDGVELLIYKQPHRPDEPIFYHDRAAYDRLFERLAARSQEGGVHYVDLETIVPAEYWGLTSGMRPDVFHFRDQGHRNLGAAIDAFMAGRDR